MAIKYLSEHDTPDDPGGLIRQALDMGPGFPGPAEDVLLAWMLRLGEGRDAATAARRLIDGYGIAGGSAVEGPLGKLISLLHQTAHCAPAHIPARRGGRARRRDS